MGYFQVRYNSRVVKYDRRGFIRLATGLPAYQIIMSGIACLCQKYVLRKKAMSVKVNLH